LLLHITVRFFWNSDSGSGDFFSLTLVNGYVHFKYDLGSGLANITSRRSGTKRSPSHPPVSVVINHFLTKQEFEKELSSC
jgi:hypothetical protein